MLVEWDIEVTDQFVEWWSTLSAAQRESVTGRGSICSRDVADRAAADCTDITA
jgi:hypothetical protein